MSLSSRPDVQLQDDVLSCIGLAEKSIPAWLVGRGPHAKSIDLSFGQVQSVEHLADFKNLESIVLDQNEIDSLDSFPVLPSLETLSLNKNNITSLKAVIRAAKKKFPNLKFISLLGNPCCPSELSGGTEAQYAEYRRAVSKALPSLQFIDSLPITKEERPVTVVSITDAKLSKGLITQEEHDHIMQMHALIAQLDGNSADKLLASSDEEDDEEEVDESLQEYRDEVGRTRQQAFNELLAASRSQGAPEETAPGPRASALDPDGTQVLEKVIGMGLQSKEKDTPRADIKDEIDGAASYAQNTEPLYDQRTTGQAPPIETTVDYDIASKSRVAEDFDSAQASQPTYEKVAPANEYLEPLPGSLKRSGSTISKAEQVSEWEKEFEQLGQIRKVTLKRGPTGLDMRIIQDDNYLRVAELNPKGVAEQAGVLMGDVLLSANGVGLVGASEKQGVDVLSHDEVIQIDVADMSLPLPNEAPSNAFERATQVSKSFVMRPIYCELEVKKINGNVPFSIIVDGPEPIIAIDGEEGLSAAPRNGDVLTAVDGDKVNCQNVEEILKAADTDFNIDVIRYVGASKKKKNVSKKKTSGNGDLPPGWKVQQAEDGTLLYINPDTNEPQEHKPGTKPIPALILECTLSGVTTGSQPDPARGKDKKLLKVAAKNAKKEAKRRVSVDSTTPIMPGKISLKITPTYIRATKIAVKTRRKSSTVDAAAETKGFQIGNSDVFTVVSRKKKLLLMVQPAPPNPASCYILKFGRESDCSMATAACMSLPGHITLPTKPKKPRRSKRKDKAKANEEKKRASERKSSEAQPEPTPEKSASEEKPKPRRKLVRGGNAIEQKVLPEFASAMDALADLDGFLDQSESTDADLAEASPEVASDAYRGKSRKWFREFSRKQTDEGNDSKVLNSPESATSKAYDSDSGDSVASSVFDDDADDADTAEVFRLLEVKRKEREEQLKQRQEELAAQAAVMKAELEAARTMEMAKIEQQKAKEREEELAYKEYCEIGAAKRLQALSFKFKWQQPQPTN
eukprot:m.168472 g.168472  ORF g.168472 m.168472 type:complete len:1024 (+) comp15319_c2_seq1:135-3206(+)